MAGTGSETGDCDMNDQSGAEAAAVAAAAADPATAAAMAAAWDVDIGELPARAITHLPMAADIPYIAVGQCMLTRSNPS